ncbi:MAG: HEPN domain-containing protein [Cytophagales bacterium]|nr:HEPN domain-containing protein [Cytophagales bacterium]
MKSKQEIIKNWIIKGDHDLGTSKLTLEHIAEYKDIIGFHCQQAVEKYLKGYLIFLDIDFEHKHNLTYLLDLISSKDKFSDQYYKMVDKLEDYAVEIRYPEKIVEPTDKELQDAINIADKFRKIILDKMNFYV